MEIVPTILGGEFYEIENKIKILSDLPNGLITRASIDIVDGKFAEPASWPYTLDDDVDSAISEFKKIKTDIKLGLHMMVSYPEDFLDDWIDSPIDWIMIHAEALQDVENLFAILDMSKIKSGVVLKLGTDVDMLEDVIERVDMIQLMSIDKLGSYGAEFCPEIFDKIKEVKKKYPSKSIAVDGGIDESHIKDLKKAGVDFAQIGNAVWKNAKVEENILKLKHALT